MLANIWDILRTFWASGNDDATAKCWSQLTVVRHRMTRHYVQPWILGLWEPAAEFAPPSTLENDAWYCSLNGCRSTKMSPWMCSRCGAGYCAKVCQKRFVHSFYCFIDGASISDMYIYGCKRDWKLHKRGRCESMCGRAWSLSSVDDPVLTSRTKWMTRLVVLDAWILLKLKTQKGMRRGGEQK